MKLLPFDNITYNSKLNKDEIINRLLENIEPQKTFRLGILKSENTKPYEGYIKSTTFCIKRIINNRNSFLPRITGTIEKNFDETTIKVNMKLHLFVLIFLCVWCGIVGSMCIYIMIEFIGNSKFDPGMLIPFGMLLFAYLLTMVSFKIESSRSKKDLQAIFEAKIIKK